MGTFQVAFLFRPKSCYCCSCDGERKPSCLTDSKEGQSLVTWRGTQADVSERVTVWGHNGMVLSHRWLLALSARSTWGWAFIAFRLEAPRKAADEQHEEPENLNQEARWTGSWSLCLSMWVFASQGLPVSLCSVIHSFTSLIFTKWDFNLNQTNRFWR